MPLEDRMALEAMLLVKEAEEKAAKEKEEADKKKTDVNPLMAILNLLGLGGLGSMLDLIFNGPKAAQEVAAQPEGPANTTSQPTLTPSTAALSPADANVPGQNAARQIPADDLAAAVKSPEPFNNSPNIKGFNIFDEHGNLTTLSDEALVAQRRQEAAAPKPNPVKDAQAESLYRQELGQTEAPVVPAPREETRARLFPDLPPVTRTFNSFNSEVAHVDKLRAASDAQTAEIMRMSDAGMSNEAIARRLKNLPQPTMEELKIHAMGSVTGSRHPEWNQDSIFPIDPQTGKIGIYVPCDAAGANLGRVEVVDIGGGRCQVNVLPIDMAKGKDAAFFPVQAEFSITQLMRADGKEPQATIISEAIGGAPVAINVSKISDERSGGKLTLDVRSAGPVVQAFNAVAVVNGHSQQDTLVLQAEFAREEAIKTKARRAQENAQIVAREHKLAASLREGLLARGGGDNRNERKGTHGRKLESVANRMNPSRPNHHRRVSSAESNITHDVLHDGHTVASPSGIPNLGGNQTTIT